MDRIATALLGLSGVTATTVIGLLAFAEAAAFTGLVVPGELAVLFGGVLAAQGRVSLPVMAAVASVAAVAGDSVGYEVGRRFGPQLLALPWVQRVAGGRLERATEYLRRRGGRAVFFGRWTSVLRALVPGLAGLAHMPYGRFLLYNATGGVAWACVLVGLGYLGGSSYRTIERVVGRASVLLLVLLALGFVLHWGARAAMRRRAQLLALAARLGELAPARFVAGRWASQLRWLRDRFDPRVRRGLGLTGALLALVVLGVLVGVILQDLLAGEELALLDAPVARFFADHRTARAVAAARRVAGAFQVPGAALPIALAAAGTAALSGIRGGARLVASAIGALAIAAAVQAVVPLSVAGTSFPSVATAVAAAVVVPVALLAAERAGWVMGVRAAAAGAGLVVLVGFADLVSAAATLSSALAGAALGAAWALAVEATHLLRPSSPPRP